jgi:glutamate racemase
MADNRPIGIFDSGVGGLTVFKAVRNVLPNESIIYLGDLKNFPYGPRSQAEVRRFVFRIIDFLCSLDVKLVVIACHTATAAGLDAARERYDMPIVGVIYPGAVTAVEATENNRIAVISTTGTLRSQAYLHAIKELNPAIKVMQRACPELVEIVEAGQSTGEIAERAVMKCLEPFSNFGADTLLLGCTHFPVLLPVFRKLLNSDVRIVDASLATAKRVQRVLEQNRMLCEDSDPSYRMLVTDGASRFRESVKRIFNEEVSNVEAVSLD